MDRVQRIRLKIMPGVLLIGLGYIIFSIQTKPDISSYIEVRSIRVVALSEIGGDSDTCIQSGVEADSIAPGDDLFVAADVVLLTNSPGQYRTSMRNLTEDRNHYDDREWSTEIPYSTETKYCTYHPLWWWIGHQEQPNLPVGAHNLKTDYRFFDGDRVIAGSFLSEAFILEDGI